MYDRYDDENDIELEAELEEVLEELHLRMDELLSVVHDPFEKSHLIVLFEEGVTRIQEEL